ncbi:hypothetical protein Vretimale_13319 [Volvox reticuliferus]|uniref:Uncharacterized protein n=1 Tax=Volvox reticuliferus TaxID=1737510 RepID=A0A8J4GL11_9CHLO|nr:hypothetical protein Vretifemale_14079 [Volvox reticuliferus]GIM09459.1 hypothetical protein Vretimale_13319 [Volvox reticuliferus]
MSTWSLHQCHRLYKHYRRHDHRVEKYYFVPSLNRTTVPVETPALSPSRKVSDGDHATICRSSFHFIRRQHLEPEPELIPQRCSKCGGTGKCTCSDCAGRGRLSRAGYNKKNRVDMTRVVGSKWTAMQETMGWRHFRVIQCRKGASGVAFVHMQASCDPATQLWINAGNLKDRDLWAAGWLQKSEMEDPTAAMAGGVPCRACSGTGAIPCPVCDATGAVLLPPSGLGGPVGAPAGPATAAPAPVEGNSTSTDSGAEVSLTDRGGGSRGHVVSGRAVMGTGNAAGAGAGSGSAAVLGSGAPAGGSSGSGTGWEGGAVIR